MYQMLSLSLREDNEHTMSQAFSCPSVVLSVYVCLCAHVSGGGGGVVVKKNQPACLCFSPELVCFGWVGMLR